MNRQTKKDIEWLDRLAFHQSKNVKGLIQRSSLIQNKVSAHPDYCYWEQIYPWLLTPLTLWPTDILGTAKHLLDCLEKGQNVDEKLKMLIEFLGCPPEISVQEVVMAQDHLVQSGSYEKLVRQVCKYEGYENNLLKNSKFLSDWNSIKKAFSVDSFRNEKGILRRRTVQERNFRGRDWDFTWTEEKHRFQAVFDHFCYRWFLYGMEHDKPLLLKLSVNMTPYGMMIVIPSYWSFDHKRDLNWKEIMKLQKIRGVERQGPKLSPNKQAKLEEAEKARHLMLEATAKGLKGTKKISYVMEKMGWDSKTDESKLKRLLKIKTSP